MQESLDFYRLLCDEEATDTLSRKRIREAARSVLPNCTETHIAFTGNLRAWRNILEQRGNIHADLEIRRLAVALLPGLAEYAPNVFQDMEVFTDEDSHESIRLKWKKV
jgi:thymidylate synthase (FAD)